MKCYSLLYASDIELENYFNLLEDQYIDLLNEFELNKKNDLERNKQIINEILSEEISSRYYFQEGRIRTSIQYDNDIKEAIKHLKQENLKNSILSVSDCGAHTKHLTSHFAGNSKPCGIVCSAVNTFS